MLNKWLRHAFLLLASGAAVGRAFDRALYDRGTSAYLQATFHGLDRSAFLDLQTVLLSRIAQAAVGTEDSIVYRDLETSAQDDGPLGYEARLVFDFTPADATPAALLASTLARNPNDVLPVDIFGQYSVSHAVLLQCPIPCGDHGMRAPDVAAGTGAVSCTCKCDPGWTTDLDQPFESFEYCTLTAAGDDTNDTTDTTDTNDTNDTTNAINNINNGTTTVPPTSGDWRPPVPSYPPPPPASKTTKTRVPLFKWVIIGVSVIVLAIIVFVLCRTRCCGLWSLCCGGGCCGGSNTHKYPASPQRIHVHAMNPPPYYHVPAAYQARQMHNAHHAHNDGQYYPPAQYFPTPPPESYQTPPPYPSAAMAPLGHGFRAPVD